MDWLGQAEFTSWDSYAIFARQVRHERRYVFNDEITAFLKTVVATSHKRELLIPAGRIFFRAQRGIRWVVDEDRLVEDATGFEENRMKPLPDRSTEGRANPAGIPVLYLGSSVQTVVSEIRPWLGSEVSVGRFKTTRDLRAIDLTKGHGQTSLTAIRLDQLFGEATVDAETKEKAVWIDIDSAFSRPVTASDSAADYVPTQILAEVFKDQGYEAVVYRSQFGDQGYNLALFDPSSADIVSCAPYKVKRIDIVPEQMGNEWFKQ